MYGGVRWGSTWQPECHVLCFHHVHSSFPVAGIAHCAEPIPWAVPVRISTEVYGGVRRGSPWHPECHVLLKFHSAWLTECHSPSRSIPGGPAPTLCSAQLKINDFHRTLPYSSVPVRITQPPPCAPYNVHPPVHGPQKAKDFHRTLPYSSVPVRITLLPPCALHNVPCQPLHPPGFFTKFLFFCKNT